MFLPDRNTSCLPLMLISQDNSVLRRTHPEAGFYSPSLHGSLFLPKNQAEKEGMCYCCTGQFVSSSRALTHPRKPTGH